MLTDAPPRKANRLGFSESDRITTLDLPQDRCLLTISESIEAAMKAGIAVNVRRPCAEFLRAASEFYRVPACGIRVLAARPLRVRENWPSELFGDYTPETMLIRVWVRTDGSAKGNHVLRNIPEYAMPRILPSSRFSEVRVPRLMAHAGILWAGCRVIGLEWGSMPWNKVIWWAILLVSGLVAYVAYVTYLQLAPMD